MAEAFVADCATQVDYLCAKWFPQTRDVRADPRIVVPSATFVQPRELHFATIGCIVLISAAITIAIVLFGCFRTGRA